jgi:hypothetical protein
MEPVFIIGFSRTGSTLLQHILQNYTPIAVAPELHFLWPRRLHRDFVQTLKQHVGELDCDESVDRLIEMMFSKRFKGAFWRMIHGLNLDVSKLRQRILQSDRSNKSIFDALLTCVAESKSRSIMGAKFPVHYSYVHKLLEWYPNCLLIHTIRDPRAIFSSQFHKHAKENSFSITRIIVAVVQFIHVNFSFYEVANMHERLKHLPNYHLFKYELAVSHPEISLKTLCNFLGVPFNLDMLNPQVRYNTSYGEKGITKGLHPNSVNAWRNKIPKSVDRLIQLTNKNAMRKLGYS